LNPDPDPVTRLDLARRCEWVASRIARRLRETGEMLPEFYYGKGTGDLLYRFTFSPHFAPIMESGVGKEVLFSVARRLIELEKYDCFIFASDMWMFEANERYLALSEERRASLVDRGFETIERLGYGTRCELIAVIGQTPSIAHGVQIRYSRKGKRLPKVEEPLAMINFDMGGGRSKMWGDWKEPGMAERYASVSARMERFQALGMDLPVPTELVNIATEIP
jgi:hypothetical protein